jgi:transmembrane sensor
VVRLELRRGRSHFEVSKRPERAFSVRAGNVTISVVGTAFTVELVADRVGVWVDHGIVQVDWGVGHQRLQANDSGWFPPLVLSSQPLDRSARGPRVLLAEREREREPATARPDAGSAQILPDARGASQSMSQSAQELLTAADAARASGHPEQGAELLNRILHEHASDPRAPLAALTLGRLLLNDLGRPREAAAAFREVQRRAPQGPFAEDALAREIEAWVQAGDLAQARALASSYVERYPSGRHLRRVRTVAGIE